MSDSRNAHSRYQTVPDHVRASLAVKAGRGRKRTRDSRGADRNALRIMVTNISVTGSEYHDDTDWSVA